MLAGGEFGDLTIMRVTFPSHNDGKVTRVGFRPPLVVFEDLHQFRDPEAGGLGRQQLFGFAPAAQGP